MVCRRFAAPLLAALLLLAIPAAATAAAAPPAPPRPAVSWSAALAQVRAFLDSLLPPFAHRDGAAAPASGRRTGGSTLDGGGGPVCNSGTMDPNGFCNPG